MTHSKASEGILPVNDTHDTFGHEVVHISSLVVCIYNPDFACIFV